MKAPTHHFIRVRLEMAVIAFFILAALSMTVLSSCRAIAI
jgi:hypothetical protein